VAQTASCDILVPGGRLISAVSEPDAALAKARRVETKWFIIDVTRARLEAVAPLFQDRQIRIAVGDVLRLDQIRLAHEMLAGKPHRPGKIVIALDAA
jgi:NADPH:quinone reductase-like Zn-dependent oxidoreductase